MNKDKSYSDAATFFKVAFESSVKAGFIVNKEINLIFTTIIYP